MSISVITSTNRESNLPNILANFSRQNYNPKELIILLNYDYPKEYLWKDAISKYDNISVYTLGGNLSLGSCLNLGISKAKYDYIAKLDDDDYYGENYLTYSLLNLQSVKANIVGKASIYIYFKEEDILGIKHISYENKFVSRVEGSTLFFKKDIFPIIKFKDKNLGEDLEFCRDAISSGYTIYSTDRNQYIYIRGSRNDHTWKINNDFLIRNCTKIGKKLDLEKLYSNWSDI